MNWKYLRHAAWIDTRAHFVAGTVEQGALLDLGSSDGETLRHFAELRPDLRLHAVDLCGRPELYPAGCAFIQADLLTARLPWPNASMDAITCMHVVEHLETIENLFAEAARLLKPGARLYIETPHPKSMILGSPKGAAAGTFTLNFFDDPTHIRPISTGALAICSRRFGLQVLNSGISRNWLFALAYPAFRFLPASRKRYTAQGHWLGWSSYIVAQQTP